MPMLVLKTQRKKTRAFRRGHEGKTLLPLAQIARMCIALNRRALVGVRKNARQRAALFFGRSLSATLT